MATENTRMFERIWVVQGKPSGMSKLETDFSLVNRPILICFRGILIRAESLVRR